MKRAFSPPFLALPEVMGLPAFALRASARRAPFRPGYVIAAFRNEAPLQAGLGYGLTIFPFALKFQGSPSLRPNECLSG